jgi:hypothetical protein
MRIWMAITLAAGLALAGCSQKTQEIAASAGQGAVSDTASNLDQAASAVSNAASDIGHDNDESSATSTTSSTTGPSGATTTTTTTSSTD